jgi:hypothetical protein
MVKLLILDVMAGNLCRDLSSTLPILVSGFRIYFFLVVSLSGIIQQHLYPSLIEPNLRSFSSASCSINLSAHPAYPTNLDSTSYTTNSISFMAFRFSSKSSMTYNFSLLLLTTSQNSITTTHQHLQYNLPLNHTR